MKPVLLATYHQAVIDALNTLDWVNHVDEYPETVTQLNTPAVFLDIPGWDREEGSDGQTRVSLKADLFLVVDRAGSSELMPKPQIYARCLAMDLSNWVEGALFGLENVEPALFIDSEVDTFDHMLNDYIVFRVSYEQEIPIGEEFYPTPTGQPFGAVWLGRAPEIGRSHIDDYRLIFSNGERVNDG